MARTLRGDRQAVFYKSDTWCHEDEVLPDYSVKAQCHQRGWSFTGSGPNRSRIAKSRAEERVNPATMSAPFDPAMPCG
jgi:hypothetical protein